MPAKRGSEMWRTVQAAVDGGWGATLRLVIIILALNAGIIICAPRLF